MHRRSGSLRSTAADQEAASCAIFVPSNQRSPLEYTFFRPFPRLVFGCINADFCVQGRIFQRFSSSTFFPLHHSRFLWFFRPFAPFFTEFDAIFAEFQERQQILQILSKFHRISSEFHRMILIGVMSKWRYFIKIWEKLQKLSEIFLQKLWKYVRKNVYSKSLRW